MGPSTDVAAPSDVVAGLVPTTSIRKAIKGEKAKQPYAIAMKDGKPFGIGGIWENWKVSATAGSGSGHSRSSRRMPMNWWPAFTIGCR
jgi:putative SOS response-associated peptidase YedK